VNLGGRTIAGASQAIRSALALAERFARSPRATVLLVGETGTGKELFARAIHAAGDSAACPFIAVNCGAIPSTLLETELFGHEKGAFTDAKTAKPGLFETAAGGTLFLDELGDLDVALQVKLLRVIEERTVRRVGAVTERPLECRIIAATNVLLEEAVLAKSFRADLYYRLNVFRIDLPPLRQRPDDVEALAARFAAEAAVEHGVPAASFDESAIASLRRHAWPGNIRELRNVIHRAVVLADGPRIGAEHLMLQHRFTVAASEPLDVAATTIDVPPHGKPLAEVEREAILLTIMHADGNQSAAARMLDISRATLVRKLREYSRGEAVRSATDQPHLPTQGGAGLRPRSAAAD
jgi:transcriptional regulator with PAS, ATPase and Fis domain